MEVFSSGITEWECWWTDSKNMKVLFIQACHDSDIRVSSHRLSGPVRGVAVHPSRALLVTGGDDYKIKVWGTWSLRVPSLMLMNIVRPETSEQEVFIYSSWPP